MNELRDFTLRKLEEKDLATRVEWIQNPLVYSTMNLPPSITLEQTFDWYKRISLNEHRIDLVLELNGEAVAMSGLIGENNKQGEIYTFTNPNLQGKGYGSICNYLVVYYGFKLINKEIIIAQVDENNIKSSKIYDKLGFKLMDIIKKGVIKNEKAIDRLIYICNENNFNFELYSGIAEHNDTLKLQIQ